MIRIKNDNNNNYSPNYYYYYYHRYYYHYHDNFYYDIFLIMIISIIITIIITIPLSSSNICLCLFLPLPVSFPFRIPSSTHPLLLILYRHNTQKEVWKRLHRGWKPFFGRTCLALMVRNPIFASCILPSIFFLRERAGGPFPVSGIL